MKDIPIREANFKELKIKQLCSLIDFLEDVDCIESQNRLTDKILPKGISPVLHGLPVTGKAEKIQYPE